MAQIEVLRLTDQSSHKLSNVFICFMVKMTVDDDRVHLVFSILNGLRLYLPRALRSDSKSTRHLMPGVYQIFYELPSKQTKGLAQDGLYDELQLRRKQTFMTSREHKSFPVFILGGTTYVLIQSLEPGSKHIGLHQAFSKTILRTGLV